MTTTYEAPMIATAMPTVYTAAPMPPAPVVTPVAPTTTNYTTTSISPAPATTTTTHSTTQYTAASIAP